jgi:hypothetical protein
MGRGPHLTRGFNFNSFTSRKNKIPSKTTARSSNFIIIITIIIYSDSLRAGQSGDRIPVCWGGEIFRTRADRPHGGPHPASYTMGTGSFLGGKAAGAWRWPPNPPHLAPRLKKQYSYTFTPSLGLRGLL